MYGGLAPDNQPGITALGRIPQKQNKMADKATNDFINAIAEIKRIIKPYTLETQNPSGLEEFTRHIKYIYNCIISNNCFLEDIFKQNNIQLDSQTLNTLNEQIHILKNLKNKIDTIHYTTWLRNAFIINPNAYVNNLGSK